MTEQEEQLMVDLPAALVKRAVLMAHEEGRDCAGDAQLVADEVMRLRDEGQLSKNFAGPIRVFIYHRGGCTAPILGKCVSPDPSRRLWMR